MNYALIENDIVTNVIWLHPLNVAEFPNAVPIGDITAGIGDTYIDGKFYRNGELLLTLTESREREYSNTIAELDAVLINSIYENLTGGIE